MSRSNQESFQWASTTKTKMTQFILTKVHTRILAQLGNKTDVKMLKHKFKQDNQVQMKD